MKERITESGLVVVDEDKPGPPTTEFPILEGWSFRMCDDRWWKRCVPQFRQEALEALYIAIDDGGSGVSSYREKQERLKKLVDELATELLGGTPEEVERFS